ncbi:MAG: ABC transporter permease subunit [Synergistaceae bacterium]|jgi:glycine betaine/proline transport system permease protein/glycine betaine/proline transport system substrate-binding protein|nr:ABC transporter permease subunit [Synergistaceae bacterium]
MNEFINEYIRRFPSAWQLDAGDVIDNAVKAFSRDHQTGLRMIKGTVISSVSGIRWLLETIPWAVLILAVWALAWRQTKKWYVGAFYAAMMTFVGCCGFWKEMLETLSVVIAAVILCTALGFPLGVLLAMSDKANRVLRPILDTMQTMPSWVYLVPAVILFGVGTTPALLATTIYAIVPMVRLTSHGLLYVDAEMVEAARAFGSTRFQTLVKIQIPQAIPTIMTGVNQTIMMAMSMVVTCALIGAKGLGMEILVATNRVDMGKSLFPGVCIVIVAIILDRLTQAAVKRSEVIADG